MAKKRAIDKVNTAKAAAPDLGTTLAALDMRKRDYYDSLEPEVRKKYSPLILMRFMSSAPDQNGLHDYHIQAVNDIVNQDFWSLSKYPDLQHKLLCLVGIGVKQRHNWIAGPKRGSKDSAAELVKKYNPEFNEEETEMFLRMHTAEEFCEYAGSCGLDDKDLERVLKVFLENYENT